LKQDSVQTVLKRCKLRRSSC